MEIINLTPHDVNIVLESSVVTITKSGVVARCAQQTQKVNEINYSNANAIIPITQTTYGEVVDLPEPRTNTYYIVSRLVMSAASGRTDLLCPNGLVRDDNGNVIGCESLSNN